MTIARHGRFFPLRRLCAAGAVAAALTGGACASKATPPEPVDDAGAAQTGAALPDWFPAQVPPPRGGVVVEVIDQPDTGDVAVGRSVTWRVDRSYSQVLADIDATVRSIGWQPTDRLSAEDGPDAKRTSIYIENTVVEVIRVFTDANLKGTRVTIELPPT